MTDSPMPSRYERHRDECARRQATRIMSTDFKDLDPETVSADLRAAWTEYAYLDSDVTFAHMVRRQIQHVWSASTRYLGWFDENITMGTYEPGVQELADKIAAMPIDGLDRQRIDADLRKDWRIYAQSDTLIAFVDRVIDRLRDGRIGTESHVEWMTRVFVGSRRPVTTG